MMDLEVPVWTVVGIFAVLGMGMFGVVVWYLRRKLEIFDRHLKDNLGKMLDDE